MAMGTCPWCGRKVDKVIMFRGDIVGCRYCGIHTKQTNADRIRAMTDEELADALTDIGVRTLRLHKLPVAEPVIEQAKEDWLNWLKQEANDAL